MKKLNTLWALLAITLFMGGCGVSASNPTGNFKITTAILPSAQISAPYAALVEADGGTAPYNWIVRKGNWPQGIILNSSTGTIAGSPIQKGRFSITLGATDSSTPPKTTTTLLTLTVNATQVAVTTTSLPSGAQNVAYSTTLAADNGTAPYAWSVAGGTLPNGVTLQSNGTLSGTPTQTGTFSFTAEVTDSTSSTATASLSITIAAPSSPVINSLSPSSGPTSGGAVVTISGANFASGASVSFGGVAASSVTVSSASQIQAVAPGHVAGAVGVIVTENGQNSGSANFTYNAFTPAVTGVSPNSGPTAGGTTVTISGSNFLAGALVLFGATPATNVSVVSATQVQAVTPANAAGPATVSVQDPGNLGGSLSGGFTYTANQSGSPTITGVSPISGNAGSQVTITGTNFTSADVVSFGSTNASTAFVGATQLTAVVPSLSAGAYNVTVTDPDPASATLNNGFTVTAPQPAGNQSLLPGATVPSCNQISKSVPSGWTIVDANNFSGGQLCNPSNEVVGAGTVTNSSACYNGGSCLTQNVSFDQAGPDIWVKNIGGFASLYLSYWEWLDSSAAVNDEMFIADMSNSGNNGLQQEIVVDRFGNSFNTLTPALIVESQGNSSGVTVSQYGPTPNIAAGTWHQWEVEWTPNAPGASNGSVYIYRDGNLLYHVANANINGNITMSGNSSIEVGGVYSKLLWTSNGTPPPGGTCTAMGSGLGNVYQGGGASFSVLGALCPPTAPSFNRYIDDIIVMKQ